MVRITVSEELRARLSQAKPAELVELVDESGELIGRFLPGAGFLPADWEPINRMPTEEELDQLAEYEGPGLTTDQLLGRLRTRK